MALTPPPTTYVCIILALQILSLHLSSIEWWHLARILLCTKPRLNYCRGHRLPMTLVSSCWALASYRAQLASP